MCSMILKLVTPSVADATSLGKDAEETDLEIVTPGRTYILRAESKIQMRAPPCPMLML